MASNDQPQPDDEDSGFNDVFLREAYAAVPEIGEGRRWYDPPYKTILALYRISWIRRLPYRLKWPLDRLFNWLVMHNEHERNKAWSLDDPSGNIHVPSDEHVAEVGFWLAEIFPPSELDALLLSVKQRSWNKRRVWVGMSRANHEILEESRSGNGYTWWRVGEVQNINPRVQLPDGLKENLPKYFDAIELIAVQIGSGLTAVVAQFHLSNIGRVFLDTTWNRHHEPRLVRSQGGRIIAENRMWSAFRETQTARSAVHRAGRSWMKKNFPGYFVSAGENQPALDLMLFDKYDPFSHERPDMRSFDALRALGLTQFGSQYITSDLLPGLVLERVEPELCPAMETRRVWSLWGSRSSVANQIQNLDAYGHDSRAIANSLDHKLRHLLAEIAVTELLESLGSRYARIRDDARGRHGKFGARVLKYLRSTFLTLSLDTASAARDLEKFYNSGRSRSAFPLSLDPPPWLSGNSSQAALFETIDLGAKTKSDHLTRADDLLSIDREYREILSTVASLGASIDSYKVARIAFWVAGVSLVVAALTLLITEVGTDTPLTHLRSWLASIDLPFG